MSKLPGLDGLRMIAVLAVILHNAYPYEAVSGSFDGAQIPIALTVTSFLANSGWLGVQLFFVLSGFLITRILLNLEPSISALRTFLLRRALRIFPVYFFALAVLLVLFPLVLQDHIPDWLADSRQSQLWFWTYTVNWVQPFREIGMPHIWSLAIEEQFYLLWPFILLTLSHKGVRFGHAALPFFA